jgi:nucleoside-diphosphate-sugar epimerase
MATKIYVTGANGLLGREVLRQIPKAIPLVRKKCDIEGARVTNFGERSLEKILKDADTVVHLAGSRDFLDEKKTWEGNVELTRRVVESTPQSAKIVFSSSISVYGKKLAEIPADEKTQTCPDTPYAKTKLEAERIVSSHPKHAILRIGPIYGPRFEQYFRVLRRIQRKKMFVIGKGDNKTTFVHVADVAGAIKNAVQKGNGVYVLTGESIPQKRLYELAAAELGVEPPKCHMPVTVAKVIARIELLRLVYLSHKIGFIPEDISVLSSHRAFNCGKAKKQLGFRPRSVSDGVREMVSYYMKKRR